ncbi:MFS transporter [Acidobacteria bacterium AH-259-O06]|nr:MFS transporter [Acidobacteria bacterium AH-259-O06]
MAPSLTPELQRWRYQVFAITWLAYAGFYLCRRNFSVVMPLLEADLGYTKMQFATVIFTFSLLYTLGQFCGVLSDRFGPRLIVGIGLFVSIFSNLMMGFATSFLFLTAFSCLSGAGQSTGWPGLVKNMANWFRRRERGVVMGWWSTNYVLGGFFATVFATFVATHPTILAQWGWRRGFWLPAVLLFFIALSFVLMTRNNPGEAGLPDIPEGDHKDGIGAESQLPAEQGGPDHDSPSLLWGILSDPAVWVIAITYLFLKMTRYSFLYWLPLYMTGHLGYGVLEAGYISSLYELVGFSGAIIAGYTSDKLMGSRRFPVAAVMLWGLAAVCFFHSPLAAAGPIGVSIWIALIGIMTYGPDTLMSGAAAQDAGSRKGAATAAGLINGVGSIGQLCSPFLVAYITDQYGWDSLFYLFVIFALIGGSLMATKWNYWPPEAKTR